MAKFKAIYWKKANDLSIVTIYKDKSAAWYIGRTGDDQAYYPIPMGAFSSVTAAQHWSDRHFPGGHWQSLSWWDKKANIIHSSPEVNAAGKL